MARSYALFDLDHTLLPHDTQTLFCNFVLRRAPWRVVLHGLFFPIALLRAVKVVSTATAKRAFFSYLWGMPVARLRELAREFAHTTVEAATYPEMRAEILRHKHQGRTLVLNTASPGFYAREIAEVLGFDYCVATPVMLESRVPWLPRIDGENNKREVKIANMRAQVPGVAELTDEERAQCWGYSDSSADIPLLEFCGYRVLVHPSKGLQRHFGLNANTVVVRPRRPYSGRAGDLFSALLQVLGLYGN